MSDKKTDTSNKQSYNPTPLTESSDLKVQLLDSDDAERASRASVPNS